MRQSYFRNAALLTGSDVVLRLAGMGLRIYLANALGGEGMGLYQLVLAVYSLFVTLATAGIAVAAARLLTEELSRDAAAARGMMRCLLAAGLGLGLAPRVSRALTPLLTGLNGLPKLALGPVFIIWFGLGLRSKVIMSALMVFFIFVFNLYTGVRGVDPALLSGVRLLGASQGQLLTKVIWPACLPWLLTSLRTGLGLSLSGAIVGEYLGSTKGMGWLLSAAGDVFNSTRVLCCVLVLVVLIIALDAVVHLLEWRLLRWRG